MHGLVIVALLQLATLGVQSTDEYHVRVNKVKDYESTSGRQLLITIRFTSVVNGGKMRITKDLYFLHCNELNKKKRLTLLLERC